jgi:MFS family permease
MYREGRLICIVLTGTLSSFISGYELGVFNTSIEAIADVMDWDGGLKTFYTSLCTGLMNLGAITGSLIAAFYSDRLGRRRLLIYNSCLAAVASFINIWPNTGTFCVARFLAGIVAGIGSTTSPVFVNEYAPVEISGKLGSLVQF